MGGDTATRQPCNTCGRGRSTGDVSCNGRCVVRMPRHAHDPRGAGGKSPRGGPVGGWLISGMASDLNCIAGRKSSHEKISHCGHRTVRRSMPRRESFGHDGSGRDRVSRRAEHQGGDRRPGASPDLSGHGLRGDLQPDGMPRPNCPSPRRSSAVFTARTPYPCGAAREGGAIEDHRNRIAVEHL